MAETVVVSFRVAPATKARLIELAGREGKTVNDLMAELTERFVQETLAQHPSPTPADELTAEINRLLSDPDGREQIRELMKEVLKELEATPLDHAIAIEKKGRRDEKEKGESRDVEPAEFDDEELTDEEWEEILKNLKGEKKRLDAGESAFCSKCGVQLEKDESTTERSESTWPKVVLGIGGAVALLCAIARLASARSV